MDKWVELLTGLLIVVGVIWVAWVSSVYSWALLGKDLNFLHSAWIFFKGGLFWFVLMIGAFFVLLGLNDLRE